MMSVAGPTMESETSVHGEKTSTSISIRRGQDRRREHRLPHIRIVLAPRQPASVDQLMPLLAVGTSAKPDRVPAD